MSIATKAMVLNLNIGAWTGHRFDREATRKAVEQAHADEDAARVNKHLVPREALKPITSAANAIRGHFYAKTLPWKDNGDRLLTRAMFTDFIAEHEELVGKFRDAVDEFVTKSYPEAMEKAGFRMGDLFKLDDYPMPSELRRKFYVQLDIDAVTEVGDFRVEMEQDQLDDIRGSMERAMQERIGTAMHDVWQRLFTVVEKFHERMSDESTSRFYKSLVTNIEELVEILPDLNVLDDPQLEAMRLEVRKTLGGLDIEDLKQDKEARFEAAGEAKRIMDTMGGFMGAWNAMQDEKEAA